MQAVWMWSMMAHIGWWDRIFGFWEKANYYYFLFGFSLRWDPVWSHIFSFVGSFLFWQVTCAFYWWVVSTFTLTSVNFHFALLPVLFGDALTKSNPTMQFTHLSQIYLPMINNFGRPTQALFRSRLPFGSLNKITTMRSVTRLQI